MGGLKKIGKSFKKGMKSIGKATKQVFKSNIFEECSEAGLDTIEVDESIVM